MTSALMTEMDTLEKFAKSAGSDDFGILFVQIKEATAESWLKAEGKDLGEIYRRSIRI